MDTVRVLIADDNASVRASLRKLLHKDPHIDVVCEASDGIAAIQCVEEHTPDVLILDMEMPGLNGVQVAQKLSEAGGPTRILALSAYDDAQFILGMLEQGASGYLTKDEAPEQIVKAVRRVAEGEQGVFSPRARARIKNQ